MERAREIGTKFGMGPTCDVFGIPRSSFYRWLRPKGERKPRVSPRSLSEDERQEVLDILHDPRFVDLPPAQVVARLLDEDRYLCSERTMYRILGANAEVRERRDQLRHPVYEKPELLATRPNELWSWDITKLKGPVKWSYYYLYVILDVFSRYVVGWMVANRESAHLAKRLIEETCRRQEITPGQLTIHADRGPSMGSKTVVELLDDLGIERSHSRPHVSNDNPYSEAQFKTLKYRPEFPERFGSAQDARSCCGVLFDWYNNEHYHSALSWMTPADVHYGRAQEKRERRAAVLAGAYAAHPERFVRGIPKPAALPKEAWINPPVKNGGYHGTQEVEIFCPGASGEVVPAVA